ncbi:MAG: SpoIIE family protein phosphatase [Leptolyngbyaceae cyanobacterium bins.349]|nr:SpoIIE family protein phosphatase [Leptolyngbyaceae cyanobacterium bins.349]
MNLFAPATKLMKTLKYPAKFALISFVFLLPLSVLITLLFTEFQNRINFTQKELIGTEYLRPVQDLSANLLRYRILKERSHLTNSDRDEQIQLQTKITQNIQQLTQVDQKLGQHFKTQTQVKSIQENWILLKQRSRSLRPSTKGSKSKYFQSKSALSQELSNQVEALRLQVGDQSNLILDPDLDTYYLMDTVLLKLPEIQETLAQIQLLSQRILLTKELTSVERSQLLMLTGSLIRFNQELSRKLTVAFQNNPAGNLKVELLAASTEINTSLDQLIQQLNQITDDNQPPQPAIYLQQAETSLNQSFSLWKHTINQLDFLLNRRINGFQTKRAWTIAFVCATLAIAVYLLMGFYQGIMQVVSSLGAASQRMINGHLQQNVTLDSRDELADVVHSFNSVADALRQAEANYRGIFENAVEGIFQTSPTGQYLAANPMLAKIYGYASPEELIAALQDIGRQLYVNPADRDKFVQVMHTAGSIQNFEAQVYRKDGSIIWISEAARSIRDAQEKLLRYEGTVVDITQRKQAEAEIAQLTQRLQDENLRMGAELAVSRQLQQMLLPSEVELGAVPGLDIAGFMEPAAEVGGDYYDVLQQDGKVSISIGDVTGHGLESGVVMIMAQTAVRTLLANGETDPRKFLGVVNQIIYENTRRMRSPKNMTLALLEYDAGALRLIGQHEELIIVRRDGTIEVTDTLDLGFPLGLELDISPFISEANLRLELGDVAVLYTDGITEAMNTQNQQYGLEQMYRVLQENRDRSALAIRQAVIQNLMAYIGNQRVFDDITLIVIKRQ